MADLGDITFNINADIRNFLDAMSQVNRTINKQMNLFKTDAGAGKLAAQIAKNVQVTAKFAEGLSRLEIAKNKVAESTSRLQEQEIKLSKAISDTYTAESRLEGQMAKTAKAVSEASRAENERIASMNKMNAAAWAALQAEEKLNHTLIYGARVAANQVTTSQMEILAANNKVAASARAVTTEEARTARELMNAKAAAHRNTVAMNQAAASEYLKARAAAQLKKEEAQAEAALRRVTAAAANNGQVMRQSAAHVQTTGSAFHRLAVLVRDTYLGYRVLNAAVSSIKIGLEFQQQMESAGLAIASVVAANNKISDAQDRELKGAEKIAAARVVSADLIKGMRDDAGKLGLPVQQLVSGLQAAVAPAGRLGWSLDKTYDITKDLSVTMRAMNIPMDQQRQEIQDILNMDIDRNSHLAKNLGLVSSTLKEWEKQGKLYENLKEYMVAYIEAGKEFKNTWLGAMSILSMEWQNLMASFTGGLFKELIRIAKELSNYFATDEAHKAALGWGGILQDTLSGAYEIAKAITGVFTDFVAPGWMKLFDWYRGAAAGAGSGIAAGGETNRHFGLLKEKTMPDYQRNLGNILADEAFAVRRQIDILEKSNIVLPDTVPTILRLKARLGVIEDTQKHLDFIAKEQLGRAIRMAATGVSEVEIGKQFPALPKEFLPEARRIRLDEAPLAEDIYQRTLREGAIGENTRDELVREARQRGHGFKSEPTGRKIADKQPKMFGANVEPQIPDFFPHIEKMKDFVNRSGEALIDAQGTLRNKFEEQRENLRRSYTKFADDATDGLNTFINAWNKLKPEEQTKVLKEYPNIVNAQKDRFLKAIAQFSAATELELRKVGIAEYMDRVKQGATDMEKAFDRGGEAAKNFVESIDSEDLVAQINAVQKEITSNAKFVNMFSPTMSPESLAMALAYLEGLSKIEGDLKDKLITKERADRIKLIKDLIEEEKEMARIREEAFYSLARKMSSLTARWIRGEELTGGEKFQAGTEIGGIVGSAAFPEHAKQIGLGAEIIGELGAAFIDADEMNRRKQVEAADKLIEAANNIKMAAQEQIQAIEAEKYDLSELIAKQKIQKALNTGNINQVQADLALAAIENRTTVRQFEKAHGYAPGTFSNRLPQPAPIPGQYRIASENGSGRSIQMFPFSSESSPVEHARANISAPISAAAIEAATRDSRRSISPIDTPRRGDAGIAMGIVGVAANVAAANTSRLSPLAATAEQWFELFLQLTAGQRELIELTKNPPQTPVEIVKVHASGFALVPRSAFFRATGAGTRRAQTATDLPAGGGRR